ncbi:MAG: hypothetical protein R2856_29520 [Caldilineaceae bacterium]
MGLVRTRNVDDEWDALRRYLEQSKQLREAKTSNEDAEQILATLKPRPDWTIVTYLGDYRMQAQAIHNSLIEQWMRTNHAFPGLNLRTLLALFASSAADWDAVAAEWKKTTKDSPQRQRDCFTVVQPAHGQRTESYQGQQADNGQLRRCSGCWNS